MKKSAASAAFFFVQYNPGSQVFFKLVGRGKIDSNDDLRREEVAMITKSTLSLTLTGLLLSASALAQTKVEVTLVDRLDEARGFCLDTLGFQHRARPEEGLQTHSCYSYQGQLAVDQAFDAEQIDDGTFHLIEYDLCMTLTGLETGSKFALESCDGNAMQQFEHRENGRVVSVAAPGNCVTAGEGPSRHGGGGEPVHLIRDLTLEVCDGSRDSRQQWRLRETAD